MIKKVFLIIVLCSMLIFMANINTAAERESSREKSSYMLQTSIYTLHYDPQDYQNNNQRLIGLEYHYPNSNLYGVSYFKNSYEQPTWYFYFGRYFEIHRFSGFRLTSKLTFGIVDGYDNHDGRYNTWMHQMETFPGIVASIGIKKNSYRLDIIPFADAGITVLLGLEF